MSHTPSQLALVFPGQGSQSVGMLAELGDRHPSVKASFEEASDGAGADLWALSQGGPEEMLNRTEYTQPALLAAGVAVFFWKRLNGIALLHAMLTDYGRVARLIEGGFAIDLEPRR